MAKLDPAFVAELDTTDEVDVETSPPGGKPRRTIVWVVVADGNTYLRSVRGPTGKWYERIKANPAAALVLGDRRVAVRSSEVTDPAEIERVSEAFRKKYATSPYVDSICKPETLPTTVRLEPA